MSDEYVPQLTLNSKALCPSPPGGAGNSRYGAGSAG